MKRLCVLILIAVFLSSCGSDENLTEQKDQAVKFDYDKIKERGKIVALTGFNAYSYFIYKGRPMGYEYELVKRYAEHEGLELEIKLVRSIEEMFTMLNNGEGDIIAFNLTVTKERRGKVEFTEHHNITKQVLVQRRPENWRRMRLDQIDEALVRDVLELDGKSVHVRRHSAYEQRLQNIMEETGIEINIVSADDEVTTEDLIRMVAEGVIDLTVSDDNIAMLNQSYYSDLDISTTISQSQRISWAVRKNAPKLLKSINSWIGQMRKSVDYYAIYNKYYKNRRAFKDRIASRFLITKGGNISEYDAQLKQYADEIGWDWRLLASLIYQESRFNPQAESWAGAAGLMQLMPSTAEMYGVDNRLDPSQSLEGGIQFIIWLNQYWKKYVPDNEERIKFILASYNIGPGHIMDAYKLAEIYGANPQIWFGNVEEFLLRKSQPEYYNDEAVKYGYARGTETVNYVKEILYRYEHYKRFTEAELALNDSQKEAGSIE